MRISIVTISFNQAEFLHQCIESVLSQGHDDLQYIIVDAGSTDGSREIIASYGDRLTAVFEPDEGPADGLNKGFRLATGDVYGYLNADDRLLPGALKFINDEFASSRRPRDLVHGHCWIVDSVGAPKRRCFSDRFSLRRAAYGAALVIQPSTFFRSEVYRSVGGFNKENRSNWDGEFVIDAALRGFDISRVNAFLSEYRVHELSITGTGKLHARHMEYRRRMFEKIKGRCFIDGYDTVFARIMNLWSKLSNPKATLERLRYGPVYGAAK